MKPLTKREIIKGVIGDKEMSLYQIIDFCRDYKLLDAQSVRNTVNNLFTTGLLIKVAEIEKPKDKHHAGKGTIFVYALTENTDYIKRQHKGLTKPKIKASEIRSLMVQCNPLTMLYAKELKLTKEML